MNNSCCCEPWDAPGTCGCCAGTAMSTPLTTENRPGLPALRYRIGTHASFMASMKARLSNLCVGSAEECDSGKGVYPLARLTSREADDPSLALLDAWASVADVLTFYQERIVNEGYLRTATERRSVLDMAQLVGYSPRPGVSASTFLAYKLDDNFKEKVTIPKGAKAQSIPGPNEQPQVFETAEALTARAEWNSLRPRLTKPQTQDSISSGSCIYLRGINTKLKSNDLLLIEFGDNRPIPHRVRGLEIDVAKNHTLVELLAEIDPKNQSDPLLGKENFFSKLIDRPSLQPKNSTYLTRSIEAQFKHHGEAGYRALMALVPQIQDGFSEAMANAAVARSDNIRVYAFRMTASLFGHNAPRQPQYEPSRIGVELPSANPNAGNLKPQPWPEWTLDQSESPSVLFLDRSYSEILPRTYIAIESESDESLRIFNVQSSKTLSRSAYGITTGTTKITLNEEWRDSDTDFDLIRTTSIFAQSEELELAEAPIDEPLCARDSTIELADLHEGLEAGRWIIISGEREIEGTAGVMASELAMVSSVTQSVRMMVMSSFNAQPEPGEKLHSFITLATPLAYCFKRDTVTIHGNVVKATHGETRREVLGSGDGSKALQSFALKQLPLTYTAAANPSGIESSLNIFVNDIRWQQSESLDELGPTDRGFVTHTAEDDEITVIFGNGREGLRLPTGFENVRAEYRSGLGKAGNVKAGQISQPISRPLGVKEVLNPMRASGGADRETRDQARTNAPSATMALDRLVSVQDYEDFARVFAGIGKARAVSLSDGRRQLVHITIAGIDDLPIDTHSDLYQNLYQSLLNNGDPYQAIRLEVRELLLIVISAGIRILPDYQWETVVTQVRSNLLEAFSFERRALGQDVLLSEVISVIQQVAGVDYVDVDTLRGIPEKIAEGTTGRRFLLPDEISEYVTGRLTDAEGEPMSRLVVNLASSGAGATIPAQLALLTPDVPETLILNRIT